MSQLKLRGMGQTFELNVYQFSAPMSTMMTSIQVQAMLHHHPIRVDQPDLMLAVVFSTSEEKSKFNDFVRAHQMNALMDTRSPEVSLSWPQRDIINWSGFIVNYQAGAARFSVAPRVQFGIKLVDSMISDKTRIGSIGSGYRDVLGKQIPWAFSYTDDSALLTPPTPPTEPAPNPEVFGGSGTF